MPMSMQHVQTRISKKCGRLACICFRRSGICVWSGVANRSKVGITELPGNTHLPSSRDVVQAAECPDHKTHAIWRGLVSGSAPEHTHMCLRFDGLAFPVHSG